MGTSGSLLLQAPTCHGREGLHLQEGGGLPRPAGSGLSRVCGDGRTGDHTGISSDSTHVFAVDMEGARRSAENRTASVTRPPRDASRCAHGRWRTCGLRVVLAGGIWKNVTDAVGQPAPPSSSPETRLRTVPFRLSWQFSLPPCSVRHFQAAANNAMSP